MSEPSSDPDITLAFFLEVMAARVNRFQTSETRPFRVRGIPIRPTNPRPYGDGQVYSGSLKDPRTRAVIEARYPASLLDQVEWGSEAVVVGTVVYRLDPQGVIRAAHPAAAPRLIRVSSSRCARSRTQRASG